MRNYATATIEGFVTHDPVLKTTKTGKALCTFSLAVNHFSPADSEPKVSFIDVETWEKIAEGCSRSVSKGRHVMVIGPLRQDRWEGNDGKTQSKIKIVGSEVRFLENPPRAEKPAQQTA
jgi:single-strand DNA-binding protein